MTRLLTVLAAIAVSIVLVGLARLLPDDAKPMPYPTPCWSQGAERCAFPGGVPQEPVMR